MGGDESQGEGGAIWSQLRARSLNAGQGAAENGDMMQRGKAAQKTRGVRPGSSAHRFADLLKGWRQKRRLSQLELGLDAGVSQRHVSFLESGRAQPSRSMILQLCETLAVPLRERNDLLLAAGFAPQFAARPLSDPLMTQVMSALRLMLKNHEPYPALAVDRAWNIRLANESFERMTGLLGGDLWARIGGTSRNLMRLFFHPEGIRPMVTNWAAIAPLLWCRAEREAAAAGGEDMQAVLGELRPFQDASVLRVAEDTPLLPVLPVNIAWQGVRISLFTVIATFGTAQDVTADELRIETLFPADAETEALFRAMAG